MSIIRTCTILSAFIGLSALLPACSQFEACATPECRTDQHLAAQVQKTLEQTPGLEADNIDVQAVHRVVFLRGDIDSGYEKWVAGNAAMLPGVKRVQNDLGFYQ